MSNNVLAPDKLRELRSMWQERFNVADEGSDYQALCQRMVTLYDLRIERMG